ncbi:MAG: beta-galactosidase [Fibrobacteres bacterium]|nr:beta-galactosidase [Fibrobacterota bacterium]
MKTIPFLTGTQYYRYPTPEPSKWNDDLAHIKRLGFDFIQLRPQWRTHERLEGQYVWDDIDQLFDLAKKHDLKIVFKFFLECAPEWLYDKYNAKRITPDGKTITPFGEGSFYVGGYSPCFDNPVTEARSRLLIADAVKRYRSNDALLFWHAWNEARNRPFGECACSHSLAKYQEWLKNRFSTIDNLNQTLGLSETSFESIKAPASAVQYTLTALWKEWGRERVRDRVAFVADEIRRNDPNRKVLCHSGMCSLTQDIINDGSDDVKNGEVVDIYGVSLIHWAGEYRSFSSLEREAVMRNKDFDANRFIYPMAADWMRAVKKPFWINEFYSDSWGTETPHFTKEDVRLRIGEIVSSGAKGINLWQFRPELYCNESGITGIINMDGSDNERSLEFAKFNEFKFNNKELLDDYIKDKGDIAIVYDPESDAISRLEHPEGDATQYRVTYRYKNSVKGWYSLLYRNGMNVDFIPMAHFSNIKQYKAVILPYPSRFPESAVPELLSYVKDGGIVFSEPGIAQRDFKNWLHYEFPPYGLNELFDVKHGLIKDGKLPFKTKVNLFGKGKAVYFNSFPGEDAYLNIRKSNTDIVKFIKKIMGFKENYKASGNVVVKTGTSCGNKITFILNYDKVKREVVLKSGKKISVKPLSYTVIKDNFQ